MARLIDADELKTAMDECIYSDRDRFSTGYAKSFIDNAPTVDAVPVCRCKDCVHGIEEDGEIKCVASADYDEMSNDWFGFVSWHEQDWFCADGDRKGGDGLTKGGIIVDDDLKHISTTIKGEVDRKNPRTEIEVISEE